MHYIEAVGDGLMSLLLYLPESGSNRLYSISSTIQESRMRGKFAEVHLRQAVVLLVALYISTSAGMF